MVLKKIAQCFSSGIMQFLNHHTSKYQKRSKHFVCTRLPGNAPLCHPTITVGYGFYRKQVFYFCRIPFGPLTSIIIEVSYYWGQVLRALTTASRWPIYNILIHWLTKFTGHACVMRISFPVISVHKFEVNKHRFLTFVSFAILLRQSIDTYYRTVVERLSPFADVDSHCLKV